MMIETCLSRVLPVALLTPSRDCNEEDLLSNRHRPDPASHFVAVHPRQPNVEEQGVRCEGLEQP